MLIWWRCQTEHDTLCFVLEEYGVFSCENDLLLRCFLIWLAVWENTFEFIVVTFFVRSQVRPSEF